MGNDAASPSSGPRRRSESGRWAAAIALLALVLIGCFYFGRVLARRVADPTPEQLQASLVSENPPPLEAVIARFNRMDVARRREVSASPQFREYTTNLSPAQRLKFVHETMDRGIQDQIERYRKMNKEERAAFIAEARERQSQVRAQMDAAPPEERQRLKQMAANGDMQKIVERALREFLKVTTSAERAELAPLYDGALDNIRHAQTLK